MATGGLMLLIWLAVVFPIIFWDIEKPKLYPRPFFPAATRYGFAWIVCTNITVRFWWWRIA